MELHYESVYFKELHKLRSKNTICNAGAAVVSTITSMNKRSPLVLHEEPNVQLIPPHHAHKSCWMNNLLNLARARGLPAE